MRSEDNLASPLIDSLKSVSSGESPFRVEPHDARAGDQSCTEQRDPDPPGGKDVPVYHEGGVIDSTARCAALQDVYDSSGYRLSHHWDILGHVDGSVTVQRENSCLSTACTSTGKGSLAPTLPSRRVHGTTCAKVWNAVR